MEIKLLPCPLCTNPHFRGVDALRTTLVKVATNIVSCPICSEKLLGLDKLTIHLFSHIGTIHDLQKEIEEKIENESLTTSEGPVECDICSFSFTDKYILDIHQKLLHQTTPDSKTGNYSYHCHLCSKKFKMKGSLMVHLRVAHYGFIRKESESHTECSENINCTKEIEVRPQSDSEGDKDVKSGQKCQDNKQWGCEVCSKLFTTKYFLKKHKRLHTGEMPYCCTLCNKSFTFQQSYHKHMLYHSSEKPHICNECGRAFKELSTLQNHARIHSGERPFVCETCGKSFRQRVSYLVHRRIHTGVMPYKCTTCDKSFRYKVSQKSHKCLANLSSSTSTSQSEQNSSPQNVLIVPQNQSVPPISQVIPNPTQNIPKSIMNVDLDTGSISVVPPKQKCFLLQKKSILLNNNELIQISYNKTDISTNLSNPGDGGTEKVRNVDFQDTFEKLIYADPEKELFSPTLSNLLPDVESLYLNNSPTNLIHQETLNDMREKCLEEFLQGME